MSSSVVGATLRVLVTVVVDGVSLLSESAQLTSPVATTNPMMTVRNDWILDISAVHLSPLEDREIRRSVIPFDSSL